MLERHRHHLPYIVRYLLIGGFVFLIDFGSYATLVGHGMIAWQAQATSQTLALLTHFALNKYLNFRSFDRPAAHQFLTYLLVAVPCIAIGVGVVQAWVWAFGYSRISLYLAKCAAVGVNIPIGFIGHKTLTFGGGLRALVRSRGPHGKAA